MSKIIYQDPERLRILEKLKKPVGSPKKAGDSLAVICITGKGEIMAINGLAIAFINKKFGISLTKGDLIFEVIPTPELDLFINKFQQALRGSLSEFILFDETGTPNYFLLQPFFGINGMVEKVQLTINKNENPFPGGEENPLMRGSDILKSLFHNHPDAVYSFDLEGKFVNLNESAANLAEATIGELLQQNFLPFIPGDEKPKVFENFKKAGRGQELNYNTGFISRKGNRRIINVTNFPIQSSGKITGIFGIARDITEAEKNKNEIKESRRRLKKILDQSLDIICTIDGENLFKDISAACTKILGYTPEELTGRNFFDFVYPADVKKTSKVTTGIRSGIEETNFSNRYIRKDGEIIPLMWSARWDEEENLIYCICKDASEIKEAEKKLLQERKVLKAIIDNIPDFIFVVDKNHKTILTNKPFYSGYLGKEKEQETLDLKPSAYIPGIEGEKVMAENERIMKSGNAIINRKDIVYDHKGNKDVILLSKVPLRTKENQVFGLVGIGKKITETFNFEKEQKLIFDLIQSLGISRDFHTALSGTIELISRFFGFAAAQAWELGYNKTNLRKTADYQVSEDIFLSNGKVRDFKIGEGLPGKTLESKSIEVWKDLPKDGGILRKQLHDDKDIIIGIGVPVIFKDEVLAVLTFFFQQQLLKEFDIAGILKRVAVQISADIKRKITENQLNNMFLHSPNLIAVIGLDGFLKKVNPAFYKVFGYTEQELLDTPFVNFLHPLETTLTYQRLQEVAGGRSPQTFQNRCKAKSGEWKWISWSPSEFREEEGIVQLFGIDITPIKTANFELLKYRNIVEGSKDGIGLFSLGTEELFMNEALKSILGYSENELRGQKAIEDIYFDNKGQEIFSAILAGKFWEGDVQVKDKNRQLLNFHFSGGPIFNESAELIAIFGLHTDISERKAHEAALKEYGNRISNILENVTDGFFSITRDYVITYWNKAAESLLKVKKEEILNRDLWEFFPKAKKALFYSKFEEAFQSGKKIQFEEFFHPLGIWIDVNAYPGKDGLSVYFKDISSRKWVEEEVKTAKERYELVAKATREAVYDWDFISGKLEWSDVYYSQYGYNRIEKSKNLEQWVKNIHPEDREVVLQKMNEAINSSGDQWDCEYRLIREDKKIAVVLERGFITRDKAGKALRMIGSLQDITELKQNERALEELNFKLQQQADDLAVSNAELEQFAYIASHDLQEPLRMVTSFLNQLQKKYEGQLDDRARQYIHFAADGAVRMRQIILDLLEYSRVDRLNYQIEQIDLNKMLREIMQLHKNIIAESGAKIIFEELPVIKAAVTPLQRLLSNLITNSIKYRRNEETPIVSIQVAETSSHWKISIEDNGIGIEEEFFEKIFVIFQRLHPREEFSGTGIGLAICKKIVENHGGKIWVDSKPGKGSSFHFTIQKLF